MKINSEFLRSLPVGTKELELQCDSPKHCSSVATIAYRVPKVYVDQRHKRYKCSTDFIKCTVKVTVLDAEPRKQAIQ